MQYSSNSCKSKINSATSKYKNSLLDVDHTLLIGVCMGVLQCSAYESTGRVHSAVSYLPTVRIYTDMLNGHHH